MNKIIIVLCAVLAVTSATDNIDNYIKVNNDQFQRVLDGYESELANFITLYKKRVEAVAVIKEKVITSLVQTSERFTPLVLLNDFSKQCVTKYSASIASVEVTKESCIKCESIATSQLTTLLTAAENIKNAFKIYITSNYSSEIVKCGKEKPDKYISCVLAVVSKANEFTVDNQKSFGYELEAAECIAKANIKKHVDCTYDIQIEVLTSIGAVVASINKCLNGEDECKPCEEHTCAEAVNVYGNYQNETIRNPLYGRTDNPTCLQLNIH